MNKTAITILKIVFMVVFLLNSLVLAFYMRISSPQISIPDQLLLPEFKAPVTVAYDSMGIPHIHAQYKDDLIIANGYLMAKDRLWGMDFYRREAEGKLAEIFSGFQSNIIDTDYSLRAIGMYRIAQRDYPTLSTETKTFLNDFAIGVNQYITDNSKHLPLEFGILGYTPDPWTAVDSLAIIKLLAVGLTFHGGGEPLIGMALGMGVNATKLLDFARMVLDNQNINWQDPVGYPGLNVTSSQNPQMLNERVSQFIQKAHEVSILGLTDTSWFDIGSNNWVVSGNKTVTGKPFLANDPHLELQTPSIWWEVDLQCPEFHVAGMAMPGVPLVVLGRNAYMAWGATNTQIDYLDTYVEKFSSNYSQYYYEGQWRQTTIIHEKFYTNPSRTQYTVRNIYITNGTSSNDFAHGNRPVVPMIGQNVSIRWVAQDNSSIAEDLVKLAYAKTMNDFIHAAELWNAPGQNLVYADTAGNIGLFVTGDIPIRKAGYGFAPHNGTSNTYEWLKYVPASENYHIFNPLQGYIATANDHFIPTSYQYYNNTGWAFDANYRATRIRQLLQASNDLSLADMMHIQTDVYGLDAQEQLPYILNSSYGITSKIIQLQTVLRSWDGNFALNSTGATIISIWEQQFIQDTIGDDFPKQLLSQLPIAGKLVTNLLQLPENSFWFDNTTNNNKHTKSDIIIEAFNETYTILTTKFGTNSIPSDWQWGRIHKAEFGHVFGSVLGIFNGGGLVSVPGGQNTVFVGTFDENFLQTHGPSMRNIFSLDNTNTYYSVLPPGESGVLFSAHYEDQINNWATGSYYKVPVNFTGDTI